jgi:hypothetical protein
MLVDAVSHQLDLKDVNLAFRSPLIFPDTYISRMSSFSDQAAAEFLIGAGRIGLPKYLATYCEMVPDRLNNIIVGGIVWAVIVTSLLVIGILENREISNKLILGITFLSVFNINTISVLMEGGFGQFLSTPFLIAALFFHQHKDFKLLTFPTILIFLIFALNAYQDAIIIFLVIILLLMALRFFRRDLQFDAARGTTKKFIKISTLIVLVNLHQIAPFADVVLERFRSSGVVGGWDQGKVALPINLMGIFNWLPFNQTNHPWGLGFFGIVFASSLIIVFFLFAAMRKTKLQLSMVLFIVFLILNFLVYRNGLETNNYQIWKFMAYATPLILLDIFTQNYGEVKIKTKTKTKGFILRSSYLILVLAVISTATWTTDWFKFRSVSFETKEIFSSIVLSNYEIVLIGQSSGNATSLILEGDLRFFSASRAFGLPTNRSIPKREFAYLMETGQCVTDSCLIKLIEEKGMIAPKKFKKIYQDQDLVVFLGRPKEIP